MKYWIIDAAGGRSFAADHALRTGAVTNIEDANVVIVTGAQSHTTSFEHWKDKTAVLIELGTECLGVHTGENNGDEGSNLLGFARFQLGSDEGTNLIELVRQPRSSDAAIEAAKQIFEAAGMQVAICGDFPGRIIDRLVRPYYNAALRRLDEGLATASDLDKTLRLGLGYPLGPIELLERTGLEHHFDVTQALFEAYGDPAYAPARRARVAKQRSALKLK